MKPILPDPPGDKEAGSSDQEYQEEYQGGDEQIPPGGSHHIRVLNHPQAGAGQYVGQGIGHQPPIYGNPRASQEPDQSQHSQSQDQSPGDGIHWIVAGIIDDGIYVISLDECG